MDMKGEYRIPASRQQVWEALNDPAILKEAIPGCQTLEQTGENELAAKVKAKVGPVSATFNGKVSLSDLNPPESYRISGEGSGGVAGFAKGGANVHLAEEGPQTTLLSYTANADVGGKLAQIGSRLIQGTAKKMADEFFSKFSEIVAARAPAAAAAEAASAPGPAQPAAAAPERAAAPEPVQAAPKAPPPGDAERPSRGTLVWVVAGAVILVILYLFFS